MRIDFPIRTTMKKVRAFPTKIWRNSFSSSPRDGGVGRGPRRGESQIDRDRRCSSPRPSPPSDGGEGVAAASPGFAALGLSVRIRGFEFHRLKPTAAFRLKLPPLGWRSTKQSRARRRIPRKLSCVHGIKNRNGHETLYLDRLPQTKRLHKPCSLPPRRLVLPNSNSNEGR